MNESTGEQGILPISILGESNPEPVSTPIIENDQVSLKSIQKQPLLDVDQVASLIENVGQEATLGISKEPVIKQNVTVEPPANPITLVGSTPAQSVTLKDALPGPGLYYASTSRKGEKPNELAVENGQAVRVLMAFSDGWCHG